MIHIHGRALIERFKELGKAGKPVQILGVNFHITQIDERNSTPNVQAHAYVTLIQEVKHDQT